MADYNINDNKIQVKLMIHITGLFNRVTVLEDITPTKETYDSLIEEYRKLLVDLLVTAESISKHAHSEFTEITTGMLNATINTAHAEMNYITMLKGEELGTARYGDKQRKNATQLIDELVKERQRWGVKMNKLNHQIMLGEESE